jgi:hypothetical protein
MNQGLAGFVMSARWRAVVVTVVSAAAALLLPPLAYVGAAVVGLVTLRLGAIEGFGVLAAGALLLMVLGIVQDGMALPLVSSGLVLWLPVWLLALLLRQTRALVLILQASALLGAVLVVLGYLWLGDPAAWWAPRLEDILGPLFSARGLDAAEYIPELARWMTAMTAAALVLGILISLLWARAWQARLYNPGGFGAEFRALHLGRQFALASLAVVAVAQLPMAGLAGAAADIVFTLVVVYLLQGLALAHAVVHITKARRMWLIGLYGLLLFAAPQLVMLLALLGWLDAWIDVRARLGGRGDAG